MASVKGNVMISGTIGDMTFFIRNGKSFVRKKTSLDKKRMKADPNFKRTIESAYEFGAASTIGRAILDQLDPWHKKISDGQFWNRLKSHIHKTLKDGPGDRGRRTFEGNRAAKNIKGMNLNNSFEFDRTFYPVLAPFAVNMFGDWQLNVPEINPKKNMMIPEGATHYNLVFGCLVLSPFDWNKLTEKYGPSAGAKPPRAIFTESGPLPLLVDKNPAMNLMVNLPTQTGEGIIGLTGIVFSQEVDGVHYPLESGAAMRFVNVN